MDLEQLQTAFRAAIIIASIPCVAFIVAELFLPNFRRVFLNLAIFCAFVIVVCCVGLFTVSTTLRHSEEERSFRDNCSKSDGLTYRSEDRYKKLVCLKKDGLKSVILELEE